MRLQLSDWVKSNEPPGSRIDLLPVLCPGNKPNSYYQEVPTNTHGNAAHGNRVNLTKVTVMLEDKHLI